VARQIHKNHNPIVVAILGGSPVVGRSLEVMLESAGYDARFLNGSFIDKPAELPEEVGLVILTPGLNYKGRERFLNGRENAAATRKQIPVLELVTASERERADQPGYVLWPCQVKDLEWEIEVTLQSVSQAS
jgi:hypothetical protein